MSAAQYRTDPRLCQTGKLLAALEARPAGASLPELAALAGLDLARARRGMAALTRYECAEHHRVYRLTARDRA